jgi:stage V sporulation protein S
MKTKTGSDAIDRKNKVASLRVSGSTSVSKLSGAIAKYIDEGFDVNLTAIGAGAVNQGVKSVATARGMLSSRGWDVACVPVFQNEIIDGMTRTAIRLHVVVAKLGGSQ